MLITPPQRTPVSVDELLDDMKKLYPTDKVHYTYKTDCPELSIMIDRPQIEQTLINLIKNATEACCEKELAAIIIQCSLDRQSNKLFFRLATTVVVFCPKCKIKSLFHFLAPSKMDRASDSISANRSYVCTADTLKYRVLPASELPLQCICQFIENILKNRLNFHTFLYFYTYLYPKQS